MPFPIAIHPPALKEPVAVPLVDFPKIAVFKPGFWNGKQWDRKFLQQLADNFNRYSAGPEPYHRPWVSINHDQFPALAGFRFGQLSDVKLDKDGTLFLDALKVPAEVGQAVKSGMLTEPSIEFVEPKRGPDGKPVSGFTGPDGRIVDGPVIKCLTFLGADMPGVKGLPPLPDPVPSTAKFSFAGGITRRFSQMTREQVIQALQTAGFDTSLITDDVPDAFLSAVLAFVQTMNANPAGGGGGAPTGAPPAQMADQTAGLGAGTGGTLAVPSVDAGAAGPVPSQVVLKFNQQFPGMLGQLTQTIGQLSRQAQAAQAINARVIDKARDDVISSLFRECGIDGTGQITPAMQPGIRQLLSTLDHVQVRKFSDGKATGTALEEAVNQIKATYPKVKAGGFKSPQPGLNADGTDGGSSGPLSPERKARILGASVWGKSVLAKAKK